MRPKKPILKAIKDGKKIYSIDTIMIDADNEKDAVRKYLKLKKNKGTVKYEKTKSKSSM